MKRKFNPIIKVENDGLYIDDVGEWAENKYSIIGHYCNIFTRSMKNKWPNLVYIDLFSGCGYSRINNQKIILGSPLISLSLPIRFSNYIFVEKETKKIKALQNRVDCMNKKNEDINFINKDCDSALKEIRNLIPKNSLSFCFIDPYNIKINFDTIKSLASYSRIDFLILLALGMDANRNFANYINNNNEIIKELTNDENWREEFLINFSQTNKDFIRYLAKKFSENMISIGYKEPETFESIRSIIKNLPLYHLAFFSKHDLGNKFWLEVKKCNSDQLGLGL